MVICKEGDSTCVKECLHHHPHPVGVGCNATYCMNKNIQKCFCRKATDIEVLEYRLDNQGGETEWQT